MNKILINSGPSRAGWSTLEAFIRCPRLYYLTRVLPHIHGADAPTVPLSDPLVRGSIGHVGLAHEYARRATRKLGKDPEIYYDRYEAMALSAASFGDDGARMLRVAMPMVDAYFDHYDSLNEDLDVIAVEYEVGATLADGKEITQRLDLVVRDRDGRYYIIDHKLTATPGESTRYVLSGQFLLMHHFGRAFYHENFGGILVNMLGTNGVFKRIPPEPAPAALATFPSFVVQLRREIDALAGQPSSAYRPAFNEQTCVSAYGPCPMFSVCQWDWR